MTVISVDLAYKDYRDIGIAMLTAADGAVECTFVGLPLRGEPDPYELAAWLSDLAAARAGRLLLLDGPQGWRDAANGLSCSRVCERQLNTPAKSGLPGEVKPANYGPFVSFSIAVFDALNEMGWVRLVDPAKQRGNETLALESFPLSAWRSLGMSPLPSKRRARAEDMSSRARLLAERFRLRFSSTPNHDELQALVAGLAGPPFLQGDTQRFVLAGARPFQTEGTWREGYIVNPC